jgi:O-antigen/teichoic acid export membrane protein
MTDEVTTAEQIDTDDPRVISYLTLRKAIGTVGFALPFVLVIGNVLFLLVRGEVLRIGDSISGYYYTVMGGVLVGSLCAIGVFLLSYRGYDDPAWREIRYARGLEDLVSSAAGIGAIGVALFPTPKGSDPTTLEEFLGPDRLGLVHVGSAALFFIALAYISIKLFTGRDLATYEPISGARKRLNNRIYKVCGWTILISIAAIAAVWLLPDDSPIRQWHPVLWLEWLAILAFSTSWFTKGLERS